jgi:hypothetical protein
MSVGLAPDNMGGNNFPKKGRKRFFKALMLAAKERLCG